ncbi:MAG: PhoU domain-containing protein, partial [Candidatus Fermentibacteria bacterium]
NDNSPLEDLVEREAEINYLNDHINRYLMKVSQECQSEDRIDEIFQMMHCVTEIEQIGDLVTTRIVPLAESKIGMNTFFSEAGKTEILDFHLRTLKQISRAIEVFKEFNLKEAKRMEKKYKKYRLMEMDLRRTHYDRLREDIPETVATSRIHLDLIDSLKRISSHATNIARIFMEPKKAKLQEESKASEG